MTPDSALATEDRPLAWRSIFGQLSLAYHWTPDEILALTPAQLALYLQDEHEPEGVVAMSVPEGLEYVARRRVVRDAWVDQALDRRGIVRTKVRTPLVREAVSPIGLTIPSAREEFAPHQSLGQVIPQVVSRRLVRRTSLAPAGTQPPRLAVEQDSAHRTEISVSTRAGEYAGIRSRTPDGLLERGGHRHRDAAVSKLDELTRRVERIAQTTSETQAALQQLERRRSGVAQFS